MNEYKIEVASEAESKEVQELFFELGYAWAYDEKLIQLVDMPYLFAYKDKSITCSGKSPEGSFENKPHQQITLPELRILALLKRNDVNDATHVDKDGDKWFIGGGDYYLFGYEDKWTKTNEDGVMHYNPQPITNKNEITLSEALERFKNSLPVEAKYSEVWRSIDIHDTINTLLKATAFRVTAPTYIELNSNAYTEEEALKLIWNHFND